MCARGPRKSLSCDGIFLALNRFCPIVEGGKEVIKRILIGVAIASLAVFGASCSSTDTTNANTNANANANTVSETATTTAPDNSEITTANQNGVKTETRTFRNNPRVSRVVVTTRDGNRTVKVYSPSGEEREMKSGPEKALDATGDAIADSVGFVKDKSVTAADKTKEGTKTVVEKGSDTAKTVGQKTADTSKTVANKTVDTTKTVVDKTAEGAKKTGKAIKKVINP